MGKYLIKRILFGAVALLALVTITFFLMHVISSSPFAGDTDRLSPNLKEELTEKYALDDPLYVQYIRFLENAVRGDFGTSLSHRGRNVSDIIMSELPDTLSLGIVAFCIALGAGIFLGAAAAFSKRRWVSRTVAVITTVGISVPSFLFAMLIMMLFGVVLRWLPVVGLSSFKHYIMPGIALALPSIAMITGLTKTGLSEAMQQDYMVLAKSKGTDRPMLILRHALKNALLPVVTYTGPLLATLLTGSFVIETLFSIQGIGAEFVNSVSNRDYTMIIALMIFNGSFIIICNIVTDLIAAALDPRVRLK